MLNRHAFRLLLIVVLLIATNSFASENSQSQMREGVDLISQAKYESALDVFQNIIEQDPSNAQAFFFYGATLNRLGRSAEAIEKIDRSLFLSTTLNLRPHPDIAFERGLALLRLNQFDLAKNSFITYENTNPGRAQTSEFLGRAYIGLGQYDKAIEHLKIALERDSDLEPTIRLAMASIHQKKGDVVSAQQQLISLVNQPKEDNLSRLLTEQIPRAPQAKTKPWNAFIGLSGGYSDNAIALGDDQPAGADITNEEDEFFRLTAGITRNWQIDETTIAASYTFQSDLYDDIDEVNQTDHIFGLRLNHQINQKSGLGINIRERLTYVDRKSFRTEASISPSYWYRFNETVAGELKFSLAKANYLDTDFATFLDRDDTVRSVTPMLYLSFPDKNLSTNFGFYLAESEADGSDFDYGEKGLIAQADLSLPSNMQARAYYTFSDRKYDNPNSVSGFTTRRDDDLHYLNINLSKNFQGKDKFEGNLTLFGQFEYTDRDSSVDFFSFDQRVFSTGLLWEF